MLSAGGLTAERNQHQHCLPSGLKFKKKRILARFQHLSVRTVHSSPGLSPYPPDDVTQSDFTGWLLVLSGCGLAAHGGTFGLRGGGGGDQREGSCEHYTRHFAYTVKYDMLHIPLY